MAYFPAIPQYQPAPSFVDAMAAGRERAMAEHTTNFNARLGADRLQTQRAEEERQAKIGQAWQEAGGDPEKFAQGPGVSLLKGDEIFRFQTALRSEREARARGEQAQTRHEEDLLARGLDRVARAATSEREFQTRAEEADARRIERGVGLVQRRLEAEANRTSREEIAEANRTERGVAAIQRRLEAEARREDRAGTTGRPTYDSARGVLVYPDGRVLKPEGLPDKPKDAAGIGSKPFIFTTLDGREKVTFRYNENTKDYDEIGRGPAASGDIIGGADNPDIVLAAKKIIAGEVSPDFYTKRGYDRLALTAAIEKEAPGTNINELQAKFKMRQDAPTNRSVAILQSIVDPVLGQGGKVDSILEEFGKAHKELELSDYPAVNVMKLYALRQTGDPRVTRYENLRNSIAMEVGQALGAAALTDKRMETEMENLSKAASPEQAKALVGVIHDLVRARLAAFKEEQGRPKPAAGEAPAATGESGDDPWGIYGGGERK